MKKYGNICVAICIALTLLIFFSGCSGELEPLVITFDTQGGTPTDSVTKSVAYGSTYGNLPTVEREGYSFAGWWTGTDSDSTQVTSSSEVTVAVDQTLYAKWTLSTYTITFDTQGGETNDLKWTRVTYGWVYGNFPTVVLEGYTFAGWWTGTDSESTQITSSSEVTVTGDQTLYAKWTQDIYTITFDTQGGTTTDSITKSVTYGSTDWNFPTVKREAYNFNGWWTGTHNESTRVTSSSGVTVTGDLTLYAKWTATVVGYIGPSGGYVFYDKGFYSDGWRYLEAAPSLWYEGETDSLGVYLGNNDPSIQWGAYGYTVDPSVTVTAVGTGEANTENIVNYHDILEDYYTDPTKYYINNDGTVAAKVCSEYSMANGGTTYDDWFLPSRDELALMYDNLMLNDLGDFFGYDYWSSSEISNTYSRFQNFANGDQLTIYKNFEGRVRPVRAF
jgi:uncharacterized repeat protein (TIGR02543 family)